MINIRNNLTTYALKYFGGNKKLTWVIYLILAISLYLIKIHELLFGVDLNSKFPLLNIDLSSYYLWVLRGVKVLEENGQLLGYDPYMGAGRIISPTLSIGCILLTKICYYLKPIFSVEETLLYLELSLIILPPLLLIPICKILYNNSKVYIPALILLATVYGFHLPNTPGIQNGALLTFEASSFISIYIVLVLHRWTLISKKRSYLLFTILLVLVIQLHIASLILLAFPILLITLNLIWQKKRAHLLGLSFTFLTCIFANYNLFALWIETKDWYVGADYLRSNHLGIFHELFGIMRLDPFNILSAIIRSSLMLLGAMYLQNNLQKSFCHKKLLLYWLAYLITIASFADIFTLENKIQATRFILPAWIVVLIFSALQLSQKTNRFVKMTFYLGLIISGFVYKYSESTYSIPQSTPYKTVPYSNFFSLTKDKKFFNILLPEEQHLVDFISKELPRDGRLLMETADKLTFHLPAIINATSNIAQIGEEAKSSHTKNNFQIFYQGDDLTAFQEIPYLPDSNFENYLNLYNITHIATTNLITKVRLEPFIDSTSIFASELYSIFKTKVAPSWFIKGQGKVDYAINQINLSELSSGEIITKFHYIEGLRTEPCVKITPIYLLKDPVPFISFNNDNSEDEIKIYFSEK